MPDTLHLIADAFSSGQVSSKLWLCDQLEKIATDTPKIIWVYGGWYGVASFLLLSRNNMKIKHIRSFDIDPECEKSADGLLENWVWQNWKFKAITADCNDMNFTNETPDIIINCSTEHFTTSKWFEDIPKGTLVVLQSNNMTHDDHFSCVDSLADFAKLFPLTPFLYQGTLDFNYPTWKFSRYMLIGNKT